MATGAQIVAGNRTHSPAKLCIGDGKLRHCPDTPNCVCSIDRGMPHYTEPLSFSGDPDVAFDRLKAVLADRPRTRLMEEEANYLRLECHSLVFRFIDDLEFCVDRQAMKIHVRSASRTGKYDFRANRRRVEAIRRAFEIHSAPLIFG